MYIDDADVLSLLLHYNQNTPNLKDLFLTELTRKTDHHDGFFFSIKLNVYGFRKCGFKSQNLKLSR